MKGNEDINPFHIQQRCLSFLLASLFLGWKFMCFQERHTHTQRERESVREIMTACLLHCGEACSVQRERPLLVPDWPAIMDHIAAMILIIYHKKPHLRAFLMVGKTAL